jgi:membrane-associated protease RseP (regulator of RpoE activity)
VVRVEPKSAGSRAALEAGDLISAAAGIEAPSPAQLTRLFAEAPDTTPVLLVVSRGEAHYVVALEKKP